MLCIYFNYFENINEFSKILYEETTSYFNGLKISLLTCNYGGIIVKINKSVKESFVVIGKEGSTSDGEFFVQKLWDSANLHFEEVKHLAKKDENGNIVGVWGATKWIIPGYEYIYVECENDDIFPKTIEYMKDNNIPLVGAVQDFTYPQTGKNYMYFPIRKL